MKKTDRLSQLNNQCGAVGLEFTLIFPLLLVVTFGIIEFGLLMFDKALVINAAREAARAAIAFDYKPGDPECSYLDTIESDTRLLVANRWMSFNPRFDRATPVNFEDPPEQIVFLDPPLLDSESDEYVLPVRVTYHFRFLFIHWIINGLFDGAFDNGIPLNAEVKMRGEDQHLLRFLATCP